MTHGFHCHIKLDVVGSYHTILVLNGGVSLGEGNSGPYIVSFLLDTNVEVCGYVLLDTCYEKGVSVKEPLP